jgi:pyruvate/2-oxoglutarate dehydrogenase complex dihydrolipoamide dehydrogenase (E3) component
VRVGPQTYAATRALVIATGTKAVVPPVDGLAGTPYWTNREAVEAAALPKSLLVLGGGAIGCEFAQVFARFGVPVTIIEGSERVLAMEEPESSAVAAKALEANGVRIRSGVRAATVSHDGAEFDVRLSDGSHVTGEKLLVATGRAAKLEGVERLGIDRASRFIPTDEWMRAGDKTWAVGDVTGNGVFTHMAFYEADVAVRDILGQGGPAADYRAKPRVTFIDPEIGAVGMTEKQARDAGIDVKVGYLPLSSTTRGWIHGPGGDGFIKLIADGSRKVLVGATTAGPAGGEMIGAMSVAVHAAVPIETLRSTIWAYPTFHRGFGQALSDL